MTRNNGTVTVQLNRKNGAMGPGTEVRRPRPLSSIPIHLRRVPVF